MKGKLKKILPIVTIVVILISCFVLPSAAGAQISNYNSQTMQITYLDEIVFSTNGSFWEDYAKDIPSNAMVSTGYDASDCNLRMYLNSGLPGEFQIIVPNGYQLQMGISFTMQEISKTDGSRYLYPGVEGIGGRQYCDLHFYDSEVGIHGGADITECGRSIREGNHTTYNYAWTNQTGFDMGLFDINIGFDGVGRSDKNFTILVRSIHFRILSPDQLVMDGIGNKIEESTDKITNGWTPDPEKPQGSESVDKLENLEDQIMGNVQDGVGQGESLINNLGTSLAQFSAGFVFISGLFNLSLNVGWIAALLQISLALGIIAFFLNIAPSIARKISNSRKGGGS